MKSPRILLTLALCATALGSHSLQAGTVTVTSTADSGAGSLRDAIAAAANGEVIDFDPALNGATITLTSDHLLISDLELVVDASSLADGISISGNGLHRIFLVHGSSSKATLRKLELRNGNASGANGGGAIFHGGGHLVLSECKIRDNFATNNGGGIVLAFGVTAVIDRCLIVGNTASNLGFGGGIFIGGASSTLIRNSVIAGNSNPLGAGFSISNSSPIIVNCTIQGNLGGGLWNDFNSSPVIQNSIIWGNTSTGSIATQQISNSNNSSPQISHSWIEGASGAASFDGNSATLWGAGNLDGSGSNNPAFVASIAASGAPHQGGDLRLRASSPAVDSGSNLAASGQLDYSGRPRLKGASVDMGACEGGFVSFSSLYPLLDPAADENSNGVPNFQEYAMGFDPSAETKQGLYAGIIQEDSNSLLTISQRSNAFDISPTIQTSTVLDGSWSELMQNVHYTLMSSLPASGDRDELTFQLITSDPRRFYRQAFAGSN